MQSAMIRPNFIVAGAPKCGTTALCRYLREHPRVFMPKLKEPNFFAEDYPRYRVVHSEREYLRLFEPAEPRHLAVGEGSVLSLYSRRAPANIQRFDPAMKLIVMLRNPVELVQALHAQLLRDGAEDAADFEQAWRLQDARRRGARLPPGCREPALLQYRELGLLGGQLERLLELFPRDQVLLIFHEDFQRDTAAAYRGALCFLGVEDDGRREFPRVNENCQPRSPRLAAALRPLLQLQNSARRRIQLGRFERSPWISRLNLLGRLKQLNLKKTDRFPLRPEFRRELIEEFRDDVRLLAQLTERNLEHWLTLVAADSREERDAHAS